MLRAPCIDYLMARGTSITKARAYAQGLLTKLRDFANPATLNLALYNAQVSGIWSPFVSTTVNKRVAISFAVGRGGPGFCVTIAGPPDRFYDFNAVRAKNGIPPRPEFQWLEEQGIPLEVGGPFRIICVERVSGLSVRSTVVFGRKTARRSS